MSLRVKTLLILALTLTVLIGGVYSIASTIVLDGFERIESQNAHAQIGQIQEAIAREIENLDLRTGDFGRSNELYTFAMAPDERFPLTHLSAGMYENLKVDLIAVFNRTGEMVHARQRGPRDREFKDPPALLMEYVRATRRLVEHPDEKSSIRGLVLMDGIPWLIAFRPIATSAGQGPLAGTVAMARALGPESIQALSRLTQRPFTLMLVTDIRGSEDRAAHDAMREGGSYSLVARGNEDTMPGYSLFHDIFGHPAVLLRVNLPRDIHAQGRLSLSYFTYLLLAVGAVAGIGVWYSLEKLVVLRVARLGASVGRITAANDLSQRVRTTGSDELSSLAGDINRMLAALEESQRQLRAGELALRERQRLALIGEFSAGVAHEFRNPLHGVNNCLEILRARPDCDEAARELLDLAAEGLRRMDTVSRRMLQLARDDSGPKAPADAAVVIEESVAFVRLRAQKEGISIKTSVEPDLPRAVMDPVRISEAILNLLVNALDACSADGTVSVAARRRRTGGYLEISVSDDGAGIPPEIQTRIFDPFFTTKQAGEGSGLGLSIVKGILENHGGFVEVQSGAAAGTTVVLCLPLAGAAVAEETA